MIEVLGFFKGDNEEHSLNGTLVNISTILMILVLLSQFGLLNIKLPTQMIKVEISVELEMLLKAGPLLVASAITIVTFLMALLGVDEQKRSRIDLRLARLFGTVIFIYALYSFLVSFGELIVEPSLDGTFLEDEKKQFVLQVGGYTFTFILFFAEYELKQIFIFKSLYGDKTSDNVQLYNTFCFLFNKELTDEQIEEIKTIINSILLAKKKDIIVDILSEEYRLILNQMGYLEFFKNGFMIGVDLDSIGLPPYVLDAFAREINISLEQKHYNYQIIASYEKYEIICISRDVHGEDVFEIIRIDNSHSWMTTK